jgi:histidinol dehydrogenase
MIAVEALEAIDEAEFTKRVQGEDPATADFVAEVITRIHAEGDAALRDLTWQLDGVDLAHPWLDGAQWEELCADCPPAVATAIDNNLARIRAFHERQRGAEDTLEIVPGVTLGRKAIPYNRVACYVPGGRAIYPSSVLMAVVPAVIAGVAEIIVTTPPHQRQRIDPAVAYAARAAGATGILLAGGAQAIAALAIGTDMVQAVDAIVGPGNKFVTAAKRQLQDFVRIDGPAGPSELLILADKTANSAFIVADLIAQAEHAPDAQVILVTDSESLAKKVAKELESEALVAARSQIVCDSLRAYGAILVANTMADAVDFANKYAPEHLQIMTNNADELLGQIRNAGSVFVGPYAPVAVGDYGSGTNHVLPTMGFARLQGGLAVDHFRKWVTWQSLTKEGLAALADDITTLALAEGLAGHAQSVRERL